MPSPLSATHEQILGTIKWYRKNRIPFRFKCQNETITIFSDKGSYSNWKREYTIPEINFIKEVKRHIIKNNLQEPYRDYFKGDTDPEVKYFSYHPRLVPEQLIANCDNIDISACYWETANKFSLFAGRPDIYERGLSWEKALREMGGDLDIAEKALLEKIKKGEVDVIRKQVRLAAIGSLAKEETWYEFDGKKQIPLPPVRSDATEFLWDIIADYVGNVLSNVAKACGDDFIFFWVDGIYVKSTKKRLVERLFKQAGYRSKSYKVPWIKTTPRHIILKCPEKIREVERGGRKILTDEIPFPFRNGIV